MQRRTELRTVTLERNGLILENMALKAQLKDVDDLAALVSRLAHSLRQAAPDNEIATLAVDYLQRKRLIGSPLRQVPNAEITGSALLRSPG